MSFFRTNPSSDEAGFESPESKNAEASTSPQPGQNAGGLPLFRQDNALPETLAGEHISLSAYISKHLNGGDGEGFLAGTASNPNQPDRPGPSVTSGFSSSNPGSQPPQQTGIYLNSLDVDMPAGLEQYLPSPIFRLRIAKKRIDGEINELRLRINKYDRLPEKPPALQEQVTLLKKRLAGLEKHQWEISQQLSADLSVVPALYALSQQGQSFEKLLNQGLAALRQGILTLFYGQAFLNVQADNDEMQYLRELYTERLKSGSSNEAELSAIINRFEQVAQRAEQDARKLKPGSLPKRLWQEAKGLVK
jgi:hypothetical protein